MSTQNNTNELRFNRWSRNGLDRIYVNGHGTANKFWLEAARVGDGYDIKSDAHDQNFGSVYHSVCNDVIENLESIFGGEPTWQQMIDACN